MAKPVMEMPGWEVVLQQGPLEVPSAVISAGTPVTSEWVDRAVGLLAPAIAGALKIAAGSGGGKGTAAGSRQRRLPLTLPPVPRGLTGLDVAHWDISLSPSHDTLGCHTCVLRVARWGITGTHSATIYSGGTPGRADITGW